MGIDPQKLESLRENYRKSTLIESDAGNSPYILFEKWFNEALNAETPEPNAMTLATVGADHKPSARIVLLKGYSENGFIFYSNYLSRKGLELEIISNAALVFYWPILERQIRITGKTVKVSREESLKYFNNRPRESQIGAIISPQSQIIPSREFLEVRFNEYHHNSQDTKLKMPDFWGGYCLIPDNIEFWQGRPGRLHDRLNFVKKDDEKWVLNRLAP